jgi:glycosyltransferase involved in cell wall biosynthesis
MSNSLVSVIMPVYNTGKYVGEAMQSILNQTYSNFEFIIINDGSTDNSEEIILSFDDARIRYYKNEVNSKIVYTRNRGLDLAQGTYIAFLDSDDISDIRRLELQVDYLENNPQCGILGTSIINIDFNGNKIGTTVIYSAKSDAIPVVMLFKNYFCASSVMFCKEALGAIRFDTNFPVAEDYVLWLQIMEKGYKVAHLKEALTYYRNHDFNICRLENGLLFKKDEEILKDQLTKLGVNYDKEAFMFYFLMGKTDYSDYYTNYLQYNIGAVDKYLTLLLKANDITSRYDKAIFNEYLQNVWFSFFVSISRYNWALYNEVKESTFYNKLGVITKNKFFIKCILKIKN